MILTFGNTKGGVGKTTLAINMAVGLAMRGRDVLLIDGDEQGTATSFTELREQNHPDAPHYTVCSLYGAAIRTQVRQLRPKYSDIVIDVGGRDSGSLRAALAATQLVIVPTEPRSFDLWGVDQTADLIREARELNERLVAFGVINCADPSGPDNAAAGEAMKAIDGLRVLSVSLGRRKAYPNAAAAGLSVLEYVDPGNREGSQKACDEFTQLLNLLIGNAKEK